MGRRLVPGLSLSIIDDFGLSWVRGHGTREPAPSYDPPAGKRRLRFAPRLPFA
jgi:hypothetical protein